MWWAACLADLKRKGRPVGFCRAALFLWLDRSRRWPVAGLQSCRLQEDPSTVGECGARWLADRTNAVTLPDWTPSRHYAIAWSAPESATGGAQKAPGHWRGEPSQYPRANVPFLGSCAVIPYGRDHARFPGRMPLRDHGDPFSGPGGGRNFRAFSGRGRIGKRAVVPASPQRGGGRGRAKAGNRQWRLLRRRGRRDCDGGGRAGR